MTSSRAATAIIAITTLLLAVLTSSCGDSGGAHPTPSPVSLDGTLALTQRAVAASAGYRITFTGHNLVLPQWGGVDAGTVRVGTAGHVAAELDRTGDGHYTVVLIDGQTYFQRTTCDHQARIPGGGAHVLDPFLLVDLDKATQPRSVATTTSGTIAIHAGFPTLGPATIEIDAKTHRPVRLTTDRDPANGAESAWTFDGWDAAPELSPPPLTPPDQGPGGNAC